MQTGYLKILDQDSKTVPLGEYLVIGKDTQCQIRLQQPQASDRHARIEKNERGYLIRDLHSSHGTFVNNTFIREAYLQEGDVIRIGNQEMVFLDTAPPTNTFPLRSRNETWNRQLESFGNVAKTEVPILILGPSGTGKDVLAQAFHQASARNKGPFISVNCCALSETLIESELFGHVRGSFTGSQGDRKGAFETARGGTLFLDEIGDLTYSLQAKLLRALENNEIRPVGSDHTLKTDVRIISATHQNLVQKVREGSFRSDLYFRLNVLTITPPSLVARLEDFEGLLYTFARTLRVRFSFGAIERLKKHPWPGNIRELKNLVHRAAALYPQACIQEEHVEKLLDMSFVSQSSQTGSMHNLPILKEIEKQLIIKRLEVHNGNQRQAARDLGMPKSTLHDRLRYYNINPKEFKKDTPLFENIKVL